MKHLSIIKFDESRIEKIKRSGTWPLYTLGTKQTNFNPSLNGHYYFTKRTIFNVSYLDNMEPKNESKFNLEYDRFIKYLTNKKLNIKITFTDNNDKPMEMYTYFNRLKKDKNEFLYGQIMVSAN